MFSKIKSFFVAAEQTVEHDVEAIISDFTSTVKRLEAAAAAKFGEAQSLLAESRKLEDASDAASAASEKATAVAEKINALVA